MAAVCRVGDLGVGVCYAHPSPVSFTTVFFQGDPVTDVNGKQMMTIGGLGATTCGHTTRATEGSATVFGQNDKAVHTVGKSGIVIQGGTYVATTGSPDTFAGD